MSSTALLYGQAIMQAFGSGSAGGAPNIDYLSDNLALTLHTSTYAPNQDTHVFVSDLSNELATANGYSAGGQNLASKTLTYTGASNLITFDAADVTWTFTGSVTFRYAVLSDRTPGSAATQPLICYFDFGGDQTINGVQFTVVFNASGLFTVTVS